MTQPFIIFEVNEEFALKNATQTADEPHRHDYEELILLSEGNPIHFIDGNKITLEAPCIIYVAMGKIHQFQADANTRGWAIRFTNEFIPDSPLHFYSKFLDSAYISLNHSNCMSRLLTICKLIEEEYYQEHVNYEIIVYLLKALLATVEAERKKRIHLNDTTANSKLISFNNFLKILEENYKRSEEVDFYANKMNTSSRNLNLICKTIFGKSVSEIIETRKLIEAKQLLLNSEKTISEIGFEIGYKEKAYFTRVFHKKTGYTPSDFRLKMKRIFS